MTKLLEFLQQLVDEEGLATNTVKGYLTAIGKRHATVTVQGQKRPVTEAPHVQRWVQGLTLMHPPKRITVPAWSLEVVLSALKQPPYYHQNLQNLELKYLTLRSVFLVALTTARRASEVHALSFANTAWSADQVTLFVNSDFVPKCHTDWHMSRAIVLPSTSKHSDTALRKLCVKSTLHAYVRKTKVARSQSKSDQFFLCYGKNKIGEPVSKQRLSGWLKELIVDAYKRQGLTLPGQPKGHDVRKMATSWADVAGVDPQAICDAATWKSNNMFARFYRLDVLRSNRSEVGRRVLEAAASTSAEQALQSSLGDERRPPKPATRRQRAKTGTQRAKTRS